MENSQKVSGIANYPDNCQYQTPLGYFHIGLITLLNGNEIGVDKIISAFDKNQI